MRLRDRFTVILARSGLLEGRSRAQSHQAWYPRTLANLACVELMGFAILAACFRRSDPLPDGLRVLL